MKGDSGTRPRKSTAPDYLQMRRSAIAVLVIFAAAASLSAQGEPQPAQKEPQPAQKEPRPAPRDPLPAPKDQPPPASKPAPSDETGPRHATATLSGDAVVPVSGDPDGRGEASLDLDPAALEVCFSLTVSNIAPASAAHLHAGATGSAGSVVVTLTPAPTEGASAGCVSAAAELIKAILKDPGSYYVNIANPDFPNGALRGQLSAPPASAPQGSAPPS